MADAVFTACFLNTMLRNADIVGMANYAPVVNARGLIYTHPDGIVKRTTFHVFHMYTHLMEDEIVDAWTRDTPVYTVSGREGKVNVDALDIVATRSSANGTIAVSVVNKHETDAQTLELSIPMRNVNISVNTLSGASPDDYNDIGRKVIAPYDNPNAILERSDNRVTLQLPAHSINIIRIR
jgi:alpha-N-arabinofuranosidase